jgi:hypothetical protein
MYEKLIMKLKEKGIKFHEGLSSQEIKEIEKKYEILFTKELKKFYTIALPVSDGFYNWRNFNNENVRLIKQMLKNPADDLREYIDEIYWCDDWGDEPDNVDEKNKILIKKIDSAPKLIPIYSHRYIACFESKQNPVFSIHGTDIIYYGENLESYLEIEFGYKQYSEMKTEDIIPVPFWSDLL